jgi:hypothetical protein
MKNSEEAWNFALDATLESKKLEGKSADEKMEILNTQYKGMERFMIYLDTFNIEFEGEEAQKTVMLFLNYRLGKIDDGYMDNEFKKIYSKYKNN